MKHFKVGIYGLAALATIIFATLLRLALVAQNWPITNSDEDTMGLMALHIAYRGEHPVFFYGQHYMGSLEAYLGAVLFHLFGPSLFSLRLGLILMFALFLISTYLLTSLLYSKGLALLSVMLLSLGSSYVLGRELSAIGGYPETLLFGSLAFLFASWLALSYKPDTFQRSGARIAAYVCWGLAVGLGLWSDLLILPFVVMSGLLLLLFCWRELLRVLAALGILLGLAIGAYPLISYNLHAPRGEDSFTTLWLLQHGGSSHLNYSHGLLVKELLGTFQVSIPMMTGNPFCPVTELTFLGPTSPHTLQCRLIHSTWGTGYLLLFGIAILLAVWALWQSRHLLLRHECSPEERQTIARLTARLTLLGAAMLALLAYAFSDAPVDWPGIHARYLIGLLIATPAILWPLWNGISKLNASAREGTSGQAKMMVSAWLLLCIGGLFVTGTVLTFGEVPAAQAANRQQNALINALIRIGATHIYTDYWTCDRIAFVSQERIICGVINDNLQPDHNRYLRYYEIVSADPHAAYVFPIDGQIPAVERKVAQARGHYRRLVLYGYIVYQPIFIASRSYSRLAEVTSWLLPPSRGAATTGWLLSPTLLRFLSRRPAPRATHGFSTTTKRRSIQGMMIMNTHPQYRP